MARMGQEHRRSGRRGPASPVSPAAIARGNRDTRWRTLAEFSLPSVIGYERVAVQKLVEALGSPNLPWVPSPARMEQLKTAVAEATMNAIEHGNRCQADVPVSIRLFLSDNAIAAQITDQGDGLATLAPEAPDITAKLAGLQTPRGWGMFLIKSLVDDVHVSDVPARQTLELILRRDERLEPALPA